MTETLTLFCWSVSAALADVFAALDAFAVAGATQITNVAVIAKQKVIRIFVGTLGKLRPSSGARMVGGARRSSSRFSMERETASGS
jgi:hypothetical protein